MRKGKKLRLPWFDLIMLIRSQVGKIIEDVEEAREDDGEVDQSEIRNIVAENLLEVVPQIANAIWKANGGA